MLTKELLQQCMPATMKTKVTDSTVELMNAALENEEAAMEIRENLIGFSSVLKSPYYTIEEYINAVKYISYTMMGDSQNKAWAKVFPERYTRLLEKGVQSKDINAHVRHYNRTKLVNEVRDQSLIPTHILNADIFQKAINTQAELMANAKSEMVRMQAANSLLTHLKRPEAQKVELDIGVKEGSMLTDLKDITAQLAAKQLAMIQSNVYSVKDIAEQRIIQAEYEEV